MTQQMQGALQFLAAAGELEVRRENRFVCGEVSVRTAWALERRGYAERRWTGGNGRGDNYIYITDEGAALADTLIGLCPECGEDMEDEACTNPLCSEWRFGEDFDRAVRGVHDRP